MGRGHQRTGRAPCWCGRRGSLPDLASVGCGATSVSLCQLLPCLLAVDAWGSSQHLGWQVVGSGVICNPGSD